MKLTFALFLLSTAFCKAEPDKDSSISHGFGNISSQLSVTRNFLNNLHTVMKAVEESSSTDTIVSRRIKKGKKDRVSDKLDACEAKLKQPSYLAIQTADTCEIKRTTSNGKTTYKLISDTFADDTYLFSDRPYTQEGVAQTTEFAALFDKIFASSPPNVGLTFTSEDATQEVGPLVVIFKTVDIDGDGCLTYDIEQSLNQNGVLSIEPLFGDSDNVSFENCSYFIDFMDITDRGPLYSDMPTSLADFNN